MKIAELKTDGWWTVRVGYRNQKLITRRLGGLAMYFLNGVSLIVERRSENCVEFGGL